MPYTETAPDHGARLPRLRRGRRRLPGLKARTARLEKRVVQLELWLDEVLGTLDHYRGAVDALLGPPSALKRFVARLAPELDESTAE